MDPIFTIETIRSYQSVSINGTAAGVGGGVRN